MRGVLYQQLAGAAASAIEARFKAEFGGRIPGPERLLEAIREAVDGGSPMSPAIARKVVRLFRDMAPEPPPDQPLTPRERAVHLLSRLSFGPRPGNGRAIFPPVRPTSWCTPTTWSR